MVAADASGTPWSDGKISELPLFLLQCHHHLTTAELPLLLAPALPLPTPMARRSRAFQARGVAFRGFYKLKALVSFLFALSLRRRFERERAHDTSGGTQPNPMGFRVSGLGFGSSPRCKKGLAPRDQGEKSCTFLFVRRTTPKSV